MCGRMCVPECPTENLLVVNILYDVEQLGHSSTAPDQRARSPWGIFLKEYWTVYRGPGFLQVVWFGSSLAPPPHSVPGLESNAQVKNLYNF